MKKYLLVVSFVLLSFAVSFLMYKYLKTLIKDNSYSPNIEYVNRFNESFSPVPVTIKLDSTRLKNEVKNLTKTESIKFKKVIDSVYTPLLVSKSRVAFELFPQVTSASQTYDFAGHGYVITLKNTDGYRLAFNNIKGSEADFSVPILAQSTGVKDDSLPVLKPQTTPSISYSSKEQTDWIKVIIFFLVMLLGMFFKQTWDFLKKEQASGVDVANLWKIMRKSTSGISFLLAVVISPLVFYSIYFVIKDIPDDIKAGFLAFQNGFFWYYIFEKQETTFKNAVTNETKG
ncbi:hypothetical protein HNV11_13225 [Spirosoma taeanense]|uniref:Uncharacterized protein n=1 Tax=Spirosoma taeanense TaxID=2735870 RepID=A0A6M5Y7A7_9BACT|nr:hypothetical protein [Spirosoma taeanense]QJW90268.1 hypothetical protein HNV11_13225 [Spirosoma taeanense]